MYVWTFVCTICCNSTQICQKSHNHLTQICLLMRQWSENNFKFRTWTITYNSLLHTTQTTNVNTNEHKYCSSGYIPSRYIIAFPLLRVAKVTHFSWWAKCTIYITVLHISSTHTHIFDLFRENCIFDYTATILFMACITH